MQILEYIYGSIIYYFLPSRPVIFILHSLYQAQDHIQIPTKKCCFVVLLEYIESSNNVVHCHVD